LKNNRSNEIIQELLVKIVQNNLRTGDFLPSVEQLAEQYEVSRTVMREVYLALSAKGLVKSVPRLGTIIQAAEQWDWWDQHILNAAIQNKNDFSKAEEVNQYRLLLEPAVCEMAASTATPDDIHYMKSCLEVLKNSVSSLENWAEADVKFHESFLIATHNMVTIQLSKGLLKPFYYARLKGKNTDFLQKLNFHYEEQLIYAIEMKQGPLARQFMHVIIQTKN
jgi:GntR family transcriptional regulator, galactonate operon transcriptional repressor